MSSSPELKTVLFLDYPNLDRTARDLNKWIPFNLVLRKLCRDYNLLGSFVYLHNGTSKQAEYFCNLGIEVIPCLSSCDAIMGFDIAEIVRTLDPSIVIIGSHDGDFRAVAERLERAGRRVYFLVFKSSRALSSFLRSRPAIDLDQLLDSEASGDGNSSN